MKNHNQKIVCCSKYTKNSVSFRGKFLPLLLCMGLPTWALADDRATLPSTVQDYPGGAPALGGLNQFAPFKYIPPVGSAELSGVDMPKLAPEEQAVADLYAAGDYKGVGIAGLTLIEKGKVDDGVQLMVANSLAWTGRLVEAATIYEHLTNGKHADAANIGLANIQRWSGRDDIAAPIYQNVLVRDPSNPDALSGLVLTGRELRPKTSLTLGGSSDSSDEERRFATINHRWRDNNGTRIYEVETSKVKDELPGVNAEQQDLTLRFHDLNMPLKPKFELGMPTGGHKTLFGSMALTLNDDQTYLTLGRINWGRLAINPNALNLGLTAFHLGAVSWQDFSFGRLTGRINHYRISDKNTILTGNINLDTSWRPFGRSLKPYLGMEVRDAEFNAPSYWSPEEGSGTAYVGLKGEWSADDWNIYSSAQVSGRLFGDAGNGWSVSAGGKRWLSNDVAMSMNLWAMASRRDNAAYRARSMSVNLEKLWN